MALLPLVSCGGNASDPGTEGEVAAAESGTEGEAVAAESGTGRALSEEPLFDIVTSVGTIKVRLYGDTPAHRDNFTKLVTGGYYDKILFHRVVGGRLIQAGDPLTRDPEQKAAYGSGGPDYTIPAEILPNHTHIKGALAAARRSDAVNPYKESHGSQFYIVVDPDACAQLDGEFTVFGEVISGLDIVDKIGSVETDAQECPVNDVMIITIIPDKG